MSSVILPPPYGIVNLLREEQQTIGGAELSAASVSGWVAGDDGLGATCDLQRSTEYQKFDPASLRVEATTAAGVWLSTDEYVVVEPATTYRGFAWIRTEEPRLFVQVGVEWASASLAETSWTSDSWSESEVVANGGWTLISFQGSAPDGSSGSLDARRARLRVQLVDPQIGNVFWIDDAVLTPYITPDSPVLRMARRWFPEYLRLLDAEQSSPTVPMERFFDLTATTATRFLRAALAFDYISRTDGVEGYERSTLVDARYYPAADFAEERWLDWLAYVTGCRLYVSSKAASSGRTPWYLIEDNLGDWTSIEAEADWDSIENAFPQSAEAAISKVASIRARGTGVLAGTVEGMRRAARLVLSGFDKPVNVSRTDGVGVATFDTYTSVLVGDELDLYDTGVDDLDGRVTITSVSNGQRTVEFASAGIDVEPVDAYLTSSLVDITLGAWSSSIAELEDDGNGNARVTTVRDLPTTWLNETFADGFVQARPGGATFTFDGTGLEVSGVPKPVFLPTAPDEAFWVQSSLLGTNTFKVVWNDYIDPMSESNTGTVTIDNCGIWFFLVETLATQTPDPDVVIGAVEYAKPAGCIVTHRYTSP